MNGGDSYSLLGSQEKRSGRQQAIRAKNVSTLYLLSLCNHKKANINEDESFQRWTEGQVLTVRDNKGKMSSIQPDKLASVALIGPDGLPIYTVLFLKSLSDGWPKPSPLHNAESMFLHRYFDPPTAISWRDG